MPSFTWSAGAVAGGCCSGTWVPDRSCMVTLERGARTGRGHSFMTGCGTGCAKPKGARCPYGGHLGQPVSQDLPSGRSMRLGGGQEDLGTQAPWGGGLARFDPGPNDECPCRLGRRGSRADSDLRPGRNASAPPPRGSARTSAKVCCRLSRCPIKYPKVVRGHQAH